jgi:RNA recognition motif-containing protein
MSPKLASLFIGNIPYEIEDTDLVQLFAEAGIDVKRVNIPRTEDGRVKGFAFVDVALGDEDKALALGGTEFGGRTLKIDRARASERPARGGT